MHHLERKKASPKVNSAEEKASKSNEERGEREKGVLRKGFQVFNPPRDRNDHGNCDRGAG